jgi:small ubiquitin-related modifier
MEGETGTERVDEAITHSESPPSPTDATDDSSTVATTTKPVIPSANERIRIRVIGQDGHDVYFDLKPTTKWQRVLEAYCKLRAVSTSSMRFIFEGQRVNSQLSLADYNVVHNDQVDAVLQQTGGSESAEMEVRMIGNSDMKIGHFLRSLYVLFTFTNLVRGMEL